MGHLRKCKAWRIHAEESVFFRFYNDLYCYCQSIRPHPRLWEAPSDRRRTDSTGISPIRCPTSLPATLFTLGLWLVGSIIIFCAGHCHDGSHPQFAAFRCSSPRRICTWCLSILLSRNNENISPSTIHPEKIGQWNTLKAHFEKIFLFLHKIQFLFLCYMLISYQNTGENRFRD